MVVAIAVVTLPLQTIRPHPDYHNHPVVVVAATQPRPHTHNHQPIVAVEAVVVTHLQWFIHAQQTSITQSSCLHPPCCNIRIYRMYIREVSTTVGVVPLRPAVGVEGGGLLIRVVVEGPSHTITSSSKDTSIITHTTIPLLVKSQIFNNSLYRLCLLTSKSQWTVVNFVRINEI